MAKRTQNHRTETTSQTVLLSGQRRLLLIAILAALFLAAWHLNSDALLQWRYSRQTTEQLLQSARQNPQNLTLVETTAERLLAEGRPDDGAALLASALQSFPDNSKLNLLAGRAAMLRGEWKGAAALVNTALQAAPQDPDALFWSAELLYKRGRKTMAEQILRDVTKLAPERADAWQRLGEIALTARDYVGALENLNQAEKRKTDAQTALLRAQALRSLGRVSEAEEAARESLKRESSAAAYALLGQIVQATPGAARLKEARDYLQRAVDLEPANPERLKLLAINYRAAGEHRQAVNVLRHIIQLEPATSENYLLLSQSYAALGRPKLSEAALVIFNKLSPLQEKADAAQHRVIIERGSLSSQLAQAKLLLKMGRQDLARIVLNRAQAKAPDNPEIERLLSLAQGPMTLKIPSLPPDPEAETL
jgi:tetratricopeptide (TPR) repeat protein